MLQQISTSLIETSGAASGAPLVVSPNGGAEFSVPSVTDPVAASTSYSYDSMTGVLTIQSPEGTTVRVEGFPTLAQIQAGQKGEPGADGAPGTPGADGRDGRDGEQGCPGRKGDRGRIGPTGATGAVGPTGNTGPTGEVGPTGPEGKRGTDATKEGYVVNNVVNPDTAVVYMKSYNGYNYDADSGRIINMGRVHARKERSTVNVIFAKPFINRLVSLSITFLNNTTNQAKTYKIYDLNMSDGSWENAMLGGFVLQSSGSNTEDWDFYMTAIGD